MRKFLLGVALLAPTFAGAQTLPTRQQSGFDTGLIVNCIGLDGVSNARCLVPERIIVDASGNPLGTSGNPIFVSGGGGGAGVDPRVAQGSTTSGQTGILTQAAVVTGNQAYTVGQTEPLNLTPTGRLKVGISAATNIAPATLPTTTLESELVGCIYRATPPSWTDQFTGALGCDNTGRLTVLASQSGTWTDTITNTGFASFGSAGTAYQQGTGAAGANAPNVYIGGQNAALNVVNAGTFAVQAAQSGTWTDTVTQATAANLNATVVPASGASFTTTTTNGATATNQTNGSALTGIVQTTPGTTNGVVQTPTTAATAGIAPIPSGGATGGVNFKTGAGNVYGVQVTSAATAGYVIVVDTTSGADGAVIPMRCYALAANSSIEASWRDAPLRFTNGLFVFFSTTGCFTKTQSNTAYIVADVK